MAETRIKFNNESLPIATLMGRITAFKKQIGNDRLDLQPSYQRGAVWNPDFKEKLIFSILSRYLVETNNTIVEISEVIGFSDIKNFHYAFKKVLGMTPNEYRRIHKNKTIYGDFGDKRNE
jgi:hypothetical protein